MYVPKNFDVIENLKKNLDFSVKPIHAIINKILQSRDSLLAYGMQGSLCRHRCDDNLISIGMGSTDLMHRACWDMMNE